MVNDLCRPTRTIFSNFETWTNVKVIAKRKTFFPLTTDRTGMLPNILVTHNMRPEIAFHFECLIANMAFEWSLVFVPEFMVRTLLSCCESLVANGAAVDDVKNYSKVSIQKLSDGRRHSHVRFLRIVLLHMKIHSTGTEHFPAYCTGGFVTSFAVIDGEGKKIVTNWIWV